MLQGPPTLNRKALFENYTGCYMVARGVVNLSTTRMRSKHDVPYNPCDLNCKVEFASEKKPLWPIVNAQATDPEMAYRCTFIATLAVESRALARQFWSVLVRAGKCQEVTSHSVYSSPYKLTDTEEPETRNAFLRRYAPRINRARVTVIRDELMH